MSRGRSATQSLIKQSNNPTIKQSLHPPLTSVNQKVILHSVCLEHYAPARERFGQTRESEVFGCILHGARAYARARRALYGEPRNTLNTRKWVFVDLMFEQETYAIRGAVYGVYKNLGAGFPEVS